MAGLVAVEAVFGSSVVSAGRAATTVVISARRTTIGAGVVLSALLAELDRDALAIEFSIVELLDGSLCILLILVLHKSEGSLASLAI